MASKEIQVTIRVDAEQAVAMVIKTLENMEEAEYHEFLQEMSDRRNKNKLIDGYTRGKRYRVHYKLGLLGDREPIDKVIIDKVIEAEYLRQTGDDIVFQDGKCFYHLRKESIFLVEEVR